VPCKPKNKNSLLQQAKSKEEQMQASLKPAREARDAETDRQTLAGFSLFGQI